MHTHTQLVLQDMELYTRHIILYGLKNLIPVAIVIGIHNNNQQEPLIVVSSIVVLSAGTSQLIYI